MIDTIFIMPNKETDPNATLMIVVDEKDPSTDPKTYQYVYVGNINDLPSDVLTESSIINDLSTGGTDKPLSAEQGRTLNSHVNYTTCGSNAGDEVKLISDDGFELSTHLRLLVKMTNTNTHVTPRFNINNTGVKEVWYNGSVVSDTNTWSAGEVLDVYYDGGKYIATTLGGAQFSTGEKVSDVGIDDEPTTESDNLVKSGGVSKYICSNKIVGANSTLKYWDYYGVTQNSVYRIYVNNPYWTVPQGLVNDYILTIGIRFSDGTSERIVGIRAPNANTRLNYYNINIPTYTNSVVSGIYMGIRCADTDSVIFTIQNITDLTASPYKLARDPYAVFGSNSFTSTSLRAFLNKGGYETLYYDESTQQETTINFGSAKHLVITNDGHIVTRNSDANVLSTDFLLLTYNDTVNDFVAGEFYPDYIKKKFSQSISDLRTYSDENSQEAYTKACMSAGFNPVNLSTFEVHSGQIASNNKWTSSNNHIIIDIHNIKYINVFCDSEQTGDYYAFLRTYNYEVDALADYSLIYSQKGRFYVDAGNKETLVVPQDANYLYVLTKKTSVDDMRLYLEIEVSYENGIANVLGNSINEAKNTLTKDLLIQAKYSASTVTNLKLLHFSDIHGDSEAAKTINELAIKYANDINDLLCTGDVAEYFADGTTTYPNGASWWINTSGLSEKSLFVLGNHDGCTDSATQYEPYKEGGGYIDGKGKEWDFDTYIAPYATTLGITLPTGFDDSTSPYYKSCFWHKDYASQKIRLIGVDCIHRFDGILNPETGEIVSAGVKQQSNAQELWLIDRLNETLVGSGNTAEGYSVIVCCHYPIDDFNGNNEEWNDSSHKFDYNQNATGGRVMNHKTNDVTAFHYSPDTDYIALARHCMRNRVGTIQSFSKGDDNNMAAILTSWMNNGGKFVAWVCGHTHKDYMWYSTNCSGILCVVIDQAGCLRGTTTGDRSVGLNSRTCANYMVINTEEGIIKIVRLGYNINKLMNIHNYLCYDYINKKILNEG